MVALKYPDEENSYPFALEHIIGSYSQTLETYGRNPKMALPKGNYQVRIRLFGVNVNKVFKFELTNPGIGGSLMLDEV